MMSSEQDSKGSEGRGLPRGWGWRATRVDPRAMRLMPIDAHSASDLEIAFAYQDGTWTIYEVKAGGALIGEGGGLGGLAAAQAAAEAALWRCDGFGVGEVRGLPLPAILPYKQTPTALPGLAGLWRVTRWALASIGEGVEVDAVRAPVPARCPACGAILPATGIGCESCGWMGEPLPGDDERAPVEPATREPSVPTDDDELARLLRGPDGARLDDDIATVRNHAPEIWSGTREHVLRVARACELLLAERERMAREPQRPSPDRAAWLLHPVSSTGRQTIAASQYDELRGEAVALRARVAELEAELSAERVLSDEAFRACIPLRGRVAMHEEKIAELTATPPPGKVAALLARVEAEAVPDRSTWRDYTRGLNKAADIIRATLTPSPLDGVVADVLALAPALADVSGGPGKVADAWRDIARETREPRGRDGLLTIAMMAMYGALACDAAKGGDK